jgi:hypothetical protein
MPTAGRQFACDFPAFFKTEAGGRAYGGKSFSRADKIIISHGGKNGPAEGGRVSPDWKKWLDEVELLPKDVMVGSGKRTT